MSKAVLFDLDETLLDRTASLRDFVGWQAHQLVSDSAYDPEDFISRFIALDDHGKVWKDSVYAQLIIEFQLQNTFIDELLDSYLKHFADFCMPTIGASEVISVLHAQGYKLGLVSNGKTLFQERNFEALGVSDLFETVVVSEAVGLRKPEAGIFELACRNLGVLPSECVFVGDNPIADIEGAKNCGMFTVFLPSPQHDVCIQADATCESLKDLLKVIPL